MSLSPEHIEAMQAGRAKRLNKERKETISEIVTGHPCRCGITANITDKDLHKLGAGCTAPWYVCGTLDSVRRAL